MSDALGDPAASAAALRALAADVEAEAARVAVVGRVLGAVAAVEYRSPAASVFRDRLAGLEAELSALRRLVDGAADALREHAHAVVRLALPDGRLPVPAAPHPVGRR